LAAVRNPITGPAFNWCMPVACASARRSRLRSARCR
jgi:hypothetical protein